MRILSLLLLHSVINQNTLRSRQNSRHFADDILKCTFLHKDVWVSIKISLKFVPRGPINNIPALVQIMAWRRPGNKPLSEPMMASLLKYVCVTPPRWVKNQSPYLPQGTTPALLSHIWTTLAATCPSSRKTRDWWRQTRETRRPYHRKVRFVHPSTRCCRTNPINVPSLKQRIRNLKKNDCKNSIRNFSTHTLSDLDIPTPIPPLKIVPMSFTRIEPTFLENGRKPDFFLLILALSMVKRGPKTCSPPQGLWFTCSAPEIPPIYL